MASVLKPGRRSVMIGAFLEEMDAFYLKNVLFVRQGACWAAPVSTAALCGWSRLLSLHPHAERPASVRCSPTPFETDCLDHSPQNEGRKTDGVNRWIEARSFSGSGWPGQAR